MSLQLADGNLNTPLGLIEDNTVESCGIQYSHTFAIADFGESTNYKVILGVGLSCTNSRCFKIGALTTSISLEKKHQLQESISRTTLIEM